MNSCLCTFVRLSWILMLILCAFPALIDSVIAVRRLERESGVFLSLMYVVDAARRGEWEEIENYLNAFIQFNANDKTGMIFFDIRIQKYLQAIAKGDFAKAVDILRKELRVFSDVHPEAFQNLTQILAMDDFGKLNELPAVCYARTESDRYEFAEQLEKSIISCPGLRDKLVFPILDCSRLYKLIEQSICWQHLTCKISIPMTPVKTLMVDHTCTDQPPSNATEAPPLFSAEDERN